MILDYTLIAGLEDSKDKSPTNKILLTSRYRFPWQLHLNRRTRKLVAHHYFANSVFQLPNAHCRFMGPLTLEAWLIRVDPLYIGLLKSIQLDFREAKETCLYNLLVAVEDVDEYRDAVRESCGYELEESIFHIGVERIPKKREGRKRYMRAYTVKKAREIGDSPYSQYAHLDRPIPRGD
ncbi:hypothetical protein CKM354_000459100 [Cercospora kikuchii]|uniref:Uncharacterized protein n=1 Tax=Cercospora kikuchii TaxID=84275 RepID=A0A9P3FGA8_9PEZI|nr:uncharacterized protein CKM354_000459100 [Cercospora kikuchii]GIZ41280.1 hypothetical protein CKM354_000459100 [Cercospora kikuchii]